MIWTLYHKGFRRAFPVYLYEEPLASSGVFSYCLLHSPCDHMFSFIAGIGSACLRSDSAVLASVSGLSQGTFMCNRVHNNSLLTFTHTTVPLHAFRGLINPLKALLQKYKQKVLVSRLSKTFSVSSFAITHRDKRS